MTRAAKLTYLFTLLTGLVLGALAGFWYALPQLRLYQNATTLLAPDALRDFAREQVQHADFNHAQRALQLYADYVQEIEKFAPQDKVFRSARQTDLAMSFVRLAMVAESSANVDQSAQLMQRAQELYRSGGGALVSDSDLKDRVRRADGAMANYRHH